jgi:ParB family chromosome partitioning protein
MTRKGGLGKGLDALIPGGDFEPQPAPFSNEGRGSGTGGVLLVSVDRVVTNPYQPRTHFDPDELDELAASIAEHGIIQPLIVTQKANEAVYTLIAGERRLLAARKANLAMVPVIVREATPQDMVELALIENLQRSDLGALEMAEAYRQLASEFGLTHEQIADRVGKSRVSVTNTLRLLQLPASVQQALANNEISEGHARALLGLSSGQAQAAALRSILEKNLSVRQTEELVRRLSGERPVEAPVKQLPADLKEIQDRLRSELGTKVTLTRGTKGGTVIIHYYSDNDLEALLQKILNE